MRDETIVVVLFVVVVGLLVLRSTSRKKTTTARENIVLNNIRTAFVQINPKFGDIPLHTTGHGAYTENKTEIFLCIEDPTTGKMFPFNQLMYVALHELAHVVNKEYGHGEQFRETFRDLLAAATQQGIYDPSQPLPAEYCGVT